MGSKCPSVISRYILFSSHVCFCSSLKWYNRTYVFLLFSETSQTLGFCSLQIKQIHRWDEANDLAASQNHWRRFSTVSVSRNTLAKAMWETCRKFFMPNDRNTRYNLKKKIIYYHTGSFSSYFTGNSRNIGSCRWSLCKTHMLFLNISQQVCQGSVRENEVETYRCFSLGLLIHLYSPFSWENCEQCLLKGRVKS